MAAPNTMQSIKNLKDKDRTRTVESHSSIAAQFAAIDEELESLYVRISALKAKRNTIAPISRLPNELLIRIFIRYAVDSGTLASLKWHKIMFVCRLWREIALASQDLWSHIDVSSSHRDERIYHQLDRSGAAPLTVKLAFSTSLTYYFSFVMENAAERIVSLDLAGEAGEMRKVVTNLTKCTCPALRTLSLSGHGTSEELASSGPTVLSAEIFTNSLPVVRSLTLHDIDAPWMSLSRLEHLDLELPFNAPSVLHSFSELLSMLERSPELKTLSLHGVIPAPIRELDDQYPVVSLSTLEHMSLRANVDNCAVLLSRLVLPSTTRMYLLPLGIATGDDVRDLLIPIRKRIRAAGAPIPALLKINCSTGSQRGISYFSASISVDTALPDQLDFTKTSLVSINSHPHTDHALRQIMTKMLKAYPCDAITHLDAREATHLTAALWKPALQLLPRLETIYLLANEAATNLGKALLAAKPGAPGAGVSRLRSIRLHVFSWPDPAEQAPIIAAAAATLETLIHACHANGTPLERFEVVGRSRLFPLSEEQWELLFEIVGTIIRDERVYNPIEMRERAAEMRKEREVIEAELRAKGYLD
ncbi:hypothetical protein C8J57DRAFT_1189459 [Mycena rebaudengoi]|nr:hypothetical protein C8J57DRAFT_1189459 [Mycena rebaudengoi]